MQPIVKFDNTQLPVLALQDFLQGRSDTVAGRWRALPPFAPGLALPGPNVIAAARLALGIGSDAVEKIRLEEMVDQLGQQEPELKLRERRQRVRAEYDALLQEELLRLYVQLLYDPLFSLDVKVKHLMRSARCVPGHLWGPALAGQQFLPGPRHPAEVLVIGKHPGVDEIARGCNFIGNTTKSFQNLLEAAGHRDYGSWYVTNIVRHQNVSDGSISTHWVKDGLPLAQTEVVLLKAQWVLLLGSEPIKAFLGDKASHKTAAGRVHELRIDARRRADEPECWHTFKAVTCHHPAALLQDPNLQSGIEEALRFFHKVRSGTAEVQLPTDHRVLRTLPELRDWVDELLTQGCREFALDAEWHGPHPEEPDSYLRTVQVSWGVGRAAVLVLAAVGGSWAFDGNRRAVVAELTRLLRGPDRRIIGHNFNADLLWLAHFGLEFLEKQFETPADDPPGTPDWKPGWFKLITEGGFDTMLAAHAVEETGDLGLKDLCRRWCDMEPWDDVLENWITQYCKEKKISRRRLPGFGECPDDILLPYALWDADGSFRLYRKLADDLLNADRHGLVSWRPFHTALHASLGYLEMHRRGVLVNLERVRYITAVFEKARERLLEEIRRIADWPDFNPASTRQCAELLFGEALNGCAPGPDGQPRRLRPEGALSLGVTPYKTTGKKPKLWYRVEPRPDGSWPNPSTDKESLAALSKAHPIVAMLRDFRFTEQLLKIIHPADEHDAADDDGVLDPELAEEYSEGILQFLHHDLRIRSFLYQTTETGRTRSRNPNMQNVSFKKRTKDFQRILSYLDEKGEKHSDYRFPIQSIFQASPGTLFIEADYTGAELLGMAVQAGSRRMIDHCQRALLPEDHPRSYDIHSAVAVGAFKLRHPDTGAPLEPKKALLEKFGFKHFRDAAKPVDFGYAYGMVAETACRRAREEGVMLELEEAEALIASLESEYPELPRYYGECRFRAQDPGHLTNCFGRHRRFPPAVNDRQRGDLERQAMNYPIQSLVADVVNIAIANLRSWRRRHPETPFAMLMQIHDALLFEVPIPHVPNFLRRTLPECMESVQIWPCNLDGSHRADDNAPYYLGVGYAVMEFWGEKLSAERAAALGLPAGLNLKTG